MLSVLSLFSATVRIGQSVLRLASARLPREMTPEAGPVEAVAAVEAVEHPAVEADETHAVEALLDRRRRGTASP